MIERLRRMADKLQSIKGVGSRESSADASPRSENWRKRLTHGVAAVVGFTLFFGETQQAFAQLPPEELSVLTEASDEEFDEAVEQSIAEIAVGMDHQSENMILEIGDRVKATRPISLYAFGINEGPTRIGSIEEGSLLEVTDTDTGRWVFVEGTGENQSGWAWIDYSNAQDFGQSADLAFLEESESDERLKANGQERAEVTATVTNVPAFIYDQPSESGELIDGGILRINEEVAVLAQDGDWLQVRMTSGNVGYMLIDNVALDGQPEQSTQPESTSSQEQQEQEIRLYFIRTNNAPTYSNPANAIAGNNSGTASEGDFFILAPNEMQIEGFLGGYVNLRANSTPSITYIAIRDLDQANDAQVESFINANPGLAAQVAGSETATATQPAATQPAEENGNSPTATLTPQPPRNGVNSAPTAPAPEENSAEVIEPTETADPTEVAEASDQPTVQAGTLTFVTTPTPDQTPTVIFDAQEQVQMTDGLTLQEFSERYGHELNFNKISDAGLLLNITVTQNPNGEVFGLLQRLTAITGEGGDVAFGFPVLGQEGSYAIVATISRNNVLSYLGNNGFVEEEGSSIGIEIPDNISPSEAATNFINDLPQVGYQYTQTEVNGEIHIYTPYNQGGEPYAKIANGELIVLNLGRAQIDEMSMEAGLFTEATANSYNLTWDQDAQSYYRVNEDGERLHYFYGDWVRLSPTTTNSDSPVSLILGIEPGTNGFQKYSTFENEAELSQALESIGLEIEPSAISTTSPIVKEIVGNEVSQLVADLRGQGVNEIEKTNFVFLSVDQNLSGSSNGRTVDYGRYSINIRYVSESNTVIIKSYVDPNFASDSMNYTVLSLDSLYSAIYLSEKGEPATGPQRILFDSINGSLNTTTQGKISIPWLITN